MSKHPSSAVESTNPSGESTKGLLYALFAYVFWGVLPVYVHLMDGVDGVELIGWRVLSSVVVSFLLIACVRHGWQRFRTVLSHRRDVAWLALAGVTVLVNWTGFVIGVLSGRVLETSLGYFLNPLVSVALAVIFLGERLRVWQWIAIGLSGVGVVVMIVGYGEVPWIGLLLAFSFGFYGLIKKRVAAGVDALSGFTVETLAALPVALVMLAVSIALGGVTVVQHGPVALIAVAGFGVVTAVPLLAFAAASRRVPLSWLAFTQYIAPLMSFMYGAFVMMEPMPLERWVGFGFVWLGLVIVSIDLLRARARSVRQIPADQDPMTGPIGEIR